MANHLAHLAFIRFSFLAFICLATLFWSVRAVADDAKPKSDQPLFDIPRFEGSSLDDSLPALTTRGFQVSVLHSSLPRPACAKFDANLRLGWNDRGLLVLANLNSVNLNDHPSIDVFLTDKVGGDTRLQTNIQPSDDPSHPTIQSWKLNSKTQSNPFFDAPVSAVTKPTDGALVIAALVPWDVLALNPEMGREIGVQVYVNDGRGSQLLWFGAYGAQWTTNPLQRVRLSDRAGEPVTAAADGGYEHFRRTLIAIAADSNARHTEVKTGGQTMGEVDLSTDGRLATGQITLPMPDFGTAYGPLAVWIDGRHVDDLTLPDADGQRKDAVNDLTFNVDTVFRGPALPDVDFAHPGDAEDLLGRYTIHAKYYDRDFNEVTRADHPGRYGLVVEVTSQHQKPLKRFITLYRPPDGFNPRWMPMKVSIPFPAVLGVDEAVAREQMSAQGDYLRDNWRNTIDENDDLAVLLAGLSEISPGIGDQPRRLGPDGKDITWWYGLKKKTGDLTPYQYLVHVPDAAQQNPGEKFPLILFLHGSGERGDDLSIVSRNGPPKILNVQPDWAFKDKFIVVSPQCPNSQWWNPLQLRDLLDELQTKYPIDPKRVYLTGLSMGGYGSWQMAEWFPERFAAVAPVCGGGDPADAQRIKDIPTWVFHGGRDPVVPIANAYQMVQALRDLHGRIKFTVFPEYGHNSWEPMYDDADFYTWMLAQKRGQPAQPPSELPDTRPDDQ
jgi:predicted esterase